jgi:hypothetical protein
VDEATEYVRVDRGVGDASVTIQVGRVVAGRWWSVIGVQGTTNPPPVRIRGTTAGVGVSLGGFVTADVTVAYGEEIAKVSTQESGEVQLEVPDRSTSGHLLVLYVEDNGQVGSAFGTALPAGDFAAG